MFAHAQKLIYTRKFTLSNTYNPFVIMNENIIVYNCTELRSINNEYGIKFNDPTLKIKWPLSKPIITKKDNNAPNLSEIKK